MTDSSDEQALDARRAVSVLAQIGTPDSVRLLKKWAERVSSLLGQPAVGALKRAGL